MSIITTTNDINTINTINTIKTIKAKNKIKIINHPISLDLIRSKIKALEGTKRRAELVDLSKEAKTKLNVLLNIPIKFELRKFIFGTKLTLVASYNKFVVFLETPTESIEDFLIEKIVAACFLNEKKDLYCSAEFALWESDSKTLHTVNMSKYDMKFLYKIFDLWIKNVVILAIYRQFSLS